MKFKGRLKYYLGGFGIGLVACLILFKGRGCEWLPNERVLNSIRSSNIYYTAQDSCIMATNNISKKDIFLLLSNGDVNFSESNTKAEQQFYTINNVREEAERKNYIIEYDNLKVSFDLFEWDSVVFIAQINNLELSQSCSQEKDIAKALYMPNDMTLEKLYANKLRFEKVFSCEMECYGVNDSDIDSLFTNGKVLFNNSYPNKKPNPLYFIEYEKGDDTFVFWVEQGATKTRLKRIAMLTEEIDKSKTYSIDWLFADKEICDCEYR